MRIVVIGAGGREHALCHTLVAEGHTVIALPGNPGIADLCEVSSADPMQLDADLFVIGPEAPLVEGLADQLRASGKVVFGPGRDGAMLEGSKEFMKKVVKDAGVPTAGYEVFDNVQLALDYLETRASTPYVIKTDGLAAGKGVLVTSDLEEAKQDVREKLSGVSFGDAGRKIVIEEGLIGREVSLLVLVSGTHAVALSPATDHKRLFDGDFGPNTGGMGAYSPVPWFEESAIAQAMVEIIYPTVARLAELGIDYRGVLYAGLMITADGPRLIEYNVRFGDPEAQVVLPRLKGDLARLLYETAVGTLQDMKISFTNSSAVTVVMAAQGYPEGPSTGSVIAGVKEVTNDDLIVFQAGTGLNELGELCVTGGRVLAVTGLAPTLNGARLRAYEGVSKISFNGAQWRSDIAASALLERSSFDCNSGFLEGTDVND